MNVWWTFGWIWLILDEILMNFWWTFGWIWTDPAGGFKYFLFSPRSLRKWSNLTNIFQRGWNHQPEIDEFDASLGPGVQAPNRNLDFSILTFLRSRCVGIGAAKCDWLVGWVKRGNFPRDGRFPVWSFIFWGVYIFYALKTVFLLQGYMHFLFFG